MLQGVEMEKVIPINYHEGVGSLGQMGVESFVSYGTKESSPLNEDRRIGEKYEVWRTNWAEQSFGGGLHSDLRFPTEPRTLPP